MTLELTRLRLLAEHVGCRVLQPTGDRFDLIEEPTPTFPEGRVLGLRLSLADAEHVLSYRTTPD